MTARQLAATPTKAARRVCQLQSSKASPANAFSLQPPTLPPPTAAHPRPSPTAAMASRSRSRSPRSAHSPGRDRERYRSRTRSRSRSPTPRTRDSRSPTPHRSYDSRSRSRSRSRSPPPRRNGRYRSESRDRSRSRPRSWSRPRGRDSRDSRDRSRSPRPGGTKVRRAYPGDVARALGLPTPTQIVVERLSKNIREHHVREIFGRYGPIRDLDVPMNRTCKGPLVCTAYTERADECVLQ